MVGMGRIEWRPVRGGRLLGCGNGVRDEWEVESG